MDTTSTRGLTEQELSELVSLGPRPLELSRKLRLYEQGGVEECYVCDPERRELFGWYRHEDRLEQIPVTDGWVSPRLGIRFQLEHEGPALFLPNGERFRSYVELAQDASELAAERDEQRQRAERLAAKLRELGIEPD
jgi:hypothetical protein